MKVTKDQTNIYKLQLVVNQPYDETLEVNDDEEVASTFSPSPRPAGGKPGGYNPGQIQDNVVATLNPLTPVPAVTGRDKHWPLFRF